MTTQAKAATFSHIQLNVADQLRSTEFYVAVLAPLGFVLADEQSGSYARITNGKDAVIVLCQVKAPFRDRGYHRHAVGLNHFALSVPSRADIDRMERHLAAHKITLLGEGKVETGYRGEYYCLLFEDPDRVMIEIVYHDPYYFPSIPTLVGNDATFRAHDCATGSPSCRIQERSRRRCFACWRDQIRENYFGGPCPRKVAYLPLAPDVLVTSNHVR